MHRVSGLFGREWIKHLGQESEGRPARLRRCGLGLGLGGRPSVGSKAAGNLASAGLAAPWAPLAAAAPTSFCVITAPAASALINMSLAFHSPPSVRIFNACHEGFQRHRAGTDGLASSVPGLQTLREEAQGCSPPALPRSTSRLIVCVQFCKARRFLGTHAAWERRNACTAKEKFTALGECVIEGLDLV